MNEQLLALFGVNATDFAFVAGTVYLLVELIKGKLGTAWAAIPKWGRDIIPLIVAGLISFKLNANGATDWWQVVSLTIAAWMAPAAIHKARKVKP